MKKTVMKRVTAVVLCAAVILPLSGCWDMMEINERVYVMGVGIDTSDINGLYEYTFQLAVPTGADSAVSENNVTYKNVAITSDSFAQAVRDLGSANSSSASFEHLACVILGSKAAQVDISGMLEYLLRWSYARRQSVVVATDGSAKELLLGEYVGSSAAISAADLVQGYDSSRNRSGSVTLSRLQVALSNKVGFCLPIISAVDSMEMVGYNIPKTVAESADVSESDAGSAMLIISGMNVYNAQGLCGTLDAQNTELARLFWSGQNSGIISAAEIDSTIYHYQIERSSCTAKCSVVNNRLVFDITIAVECSLVDSGGSLKPDAPSLTEQDVAQSVTDSLELLTVICRSSGGAAPLLLEDVVRQTNNIWYADHRSEWNRYWSSSEVNLNVLCELKT